MASSKKMDFVGITALVIALGALTLTGWMWKSTAGGGGRKIAFVDTQRLMVGFKDANKVNKLLEAEDLKWKTDMGAMEDSLKRFMDSMTVKFDRADMKTKKAMQDELAMRNQQVNNFQRYHIKKMEEMTQDKMKDVYTKINVFMKEYGAAHKYDIIFGTSQGNILYGENTTADITDDVIKAIAAKYE